MFEPDPRDVEQLRTLLDLDAAQKIQQQQRDILREFRDATALLQAILREMHEARADLGRDLVASRTDMRFDTFLTEMAEAVHNNGYVALETLVNESLKSTKEDLKQALKLSEATTTRIQADSIRAFETLVSNLQAAVAGKPPLPVTPPGRGIFKRVGLALVSALARFRRFCIDAMAPALTVASITLVAYLLLDLRHALR